MRERLPPTRQNLLRVRQEAERTRAGLGLLQSKREALMKAFLSSVQERVRYHELLEARCRAASEALMDAVAVEGLAGLEPFGWAARRDFGLEVQREIVWGIPVAAFQARPFVRDFRERGFDAAAAGHRVNRAADRFEELLALVLDTAATDVRLNRLGSEIRKATRRINALEERVLPGLQRAEKGIREKLDEMERDENQRMRRLKRGREKDT